MFNNRRSLKFLAFVLNVCVAEHKPFTCIARLLLHELFSGLFLVFVNLEHTISPLPHIFSSFPSLFTSCENNCLPICKKMPRTIPPPTILIWMVIGAVIGVLGFGFCLYLFKPARNARQNQLASSSSDPVPTVSKQNSNQPSQV